jgi:hypothetical protein
MATPAYLSASANSTTYAAQINQFLGAHATTFIYTGVSLGGATTLGSGSVNTDGLYIAQEFVPGTAQTPGRFTFQMSLTGTPGPLTVSIQTSTGGAPSGTAVATTVVPYEYVPGTSMVVSIPLPCSLAASTDYWAVFNAVGDASDYYSLYKSNQTSGASTSTNGSSWTAQTYGLYYQRFDQSASPSTNMLHTYEDSGAKWTAWTWNGDYQVSELQEYIVAEGSGNYFWSQRTFTYFSESLVTVA